jgi:tetratricopeptide (TPR) repeat protein
VEAIGSKIMEVSSARIIELCREGDFESARKYCNRCFESESTNEGKSRSLYWLAQVERLEGNLNNYEKLLLASHDYNPFLKATIYSLMQVNSIKKNWDKVGFYARAILDLEIEIEGDQPFSDGANLYLAQSLLNQGNLIEAHAALDRMSPNHIEVFNGLPLGKAAITEILFRDLEKNNPYSHCYV